MRLEGNNLHADDGKWLYQDEGENRTFWPSVTLAHPENAKYFKECTDADKTAWEAEHNPQSEPQVEEVNNSED